MTRASASEVLRSGELARRAGVSADSLRVYERRGLLAPPSRGRNGYRLYPKEAIDRVLLIQRGLAFGFTLEELGRFLGARASGAAPCRAVRDAAAGRLGEVRDAIAELEQFEQSLARLVADWDASLAANPRARRQRFLEGLPPAPSRKSAAALAARRFTKPRIRKESP